MREFGYDLSDLIPENMAKKGNVVLDSNLQPISLLLAQRKIPEEGWSDETIELCLKLFTLMDTDKDIKGAKIGEREARVASPLVSKLASGFNHGIGRSGEITAAQPKAPGTSILYQIANRLAAYALKKFGAPNIKKAIVLPLSTGMSLGLTFSSIRKGSDKRKVLCTRIDHTSPIKGIELAGLIPKIIEGNLVDDAVRVDPEDIKRNIDDDTVAILSTTTFFPPREMDDIKEVAKIAKDANLYHIINNAYGVQSREIMKKIQGAIDVGRVDVIIQSTDKNFLTPIGGSLLAAPSEKIIEDISRCYAGRATAAPIIQFFAAILSLGIQGYEKLRDLQEKNRVLLEESLLEVAERHGERILNVSNPIACAMTLNHHNPKKIGGILYELRVTGPRAFQRGDKEGACHDNYPNSYLCLNAAIGSKETEIREAIIRLEKAINQSK